MTIDSALHNLVVLEMRTREPSDRKALFIAIASLKAWQEVRQEIGKLSLSWEYGQGVEDCLAIVDHYMQEVDDGK